MKVLWGGRGRRALGPEACETGRTSSWLLQQAKPRTRHVTLSGLRGRMLQPSSHWLLANVHAAYKSTFCVTSDVQALSSNPYPSTHSHTLPSSWAPAAPRGHGARASSITTGGPTSTRSWPGLPRRPHTGQRLLLPLKAKLFLGRNVFPHSSSFSVQTVWVCYVLLS